MKTRFIFFIVGIFLYACGSEEDVLPVQRSTQLSVEVLNENGITESGAEVQLYKSLEDLQSRKNAIGEAKTNAKGLALFNNLQAEPYFVYASYVSEGKFYDNESVGDVFMEKAPEQNTNNQFFTITGYKRPVKPSQVQIKACWLMDYPTPVRVYDRPDSSLQMSLPIFVNFYLNNNFINAAGPLQFYRTRLKPDESRNIALAEYLKEPNPRISCKSLKEKQLELQIFEQDLQGNLNLKKHFFVNLLNAAATPSQAYPDRVSLVVENMHLDLILGWE